jgi:hypothetical protein
MGADEKRWRSALMRSTGRTGNFAAASALSVTSDCWLRDGAEPNQNEGAQGKKKMALAERIRVATRPALPRGIGRLFLAVMGLAAAAALVVRIFALGHPVIALWLAAAFFAWAFICGASRASDAPRGPFK